MGSAWSSSSKTKEIYVHFENKKLRVAFSSKDYNSDRQIPLQRFRTKLAKNLKVSATSLVLYQLNPQKQLSDLGATLESYGIGNKSDILAVQENAATEKPAIQLSPSEQINAVVNSLDAEFGSRISAFIDAPPTDLQQREEEHRILGETVLAKTISLDNIDIKTPEDRQLRKQAIAKLQSYHANIDSSMSRSAEESKSKVAPVVETSPEVKTQEAHQFGSNSPKDNVAETQTPELTAAHGSKSLEAHHVVPDVNQSAVKEPEVHQTPISETPKGDATALKPTADTALSSTESPAVSEVSEIKTQTTKVVAPSDNQADVKIPEVKASTESRTETSEVQKKSTEVVPEIIPQEATPASEKSVAAEPIPATPVAPITGSAAPVTVEPIAPTPVAATPVAADPAAAIPAAPITEAAAPAAATTTVAPISEAAAPVAATPKVAATHEGVVSEAATSEAGETEAGETEAGETNESNPPAKKSSDQKKKNKNKKKKRRH